MQTKIEALRAARSIWEDIVRKGDDTAKWEVTDGEYLNDCPCCQFTYDSQKVFDTHIVYTDKGYPELSCSKYCPMATYWTSELSYDEYMCEHDTSPYAEWVENPTTENAKAVLALVKQAIKDLEEETKK